MLAVALASRVVRTLPNSYDWAKADTYSRVDFWIASSECTVKTGALLAYCHADRRVSGIETVSVADDAGHALIANLYALAAGRAIDRPALTAVNFALNAAALLSLSLTLFSFGWKGSGLFILWAGRSQVVPGPVFGPDAPAAFITAYGFALTAILLVAFAPLGGDRKSLPRFCVALALAMVALAVATLLRQPYGVGGFLSAATVLALRLLLLVRANPRPPLRGAAVRAAATAGCLVLATFFCTQAVVAARSLAFGIPSSADALHHGISHNLYMGLGVAGNPWGVKWDDLEASKAANTIGEARYASKEHYANLWRLYFRIVASDPLEVLRIYQVKLWDSLLVASDNEEGRFWRGAAYFVVLVGALIALRRARKPEELVVAAGAWLMFGSIILQGVLTVPWLHFIGPAGLAAFCGLVLLAEALVRQVAERFAARA